MRAKAPAKVDDRRARPSAKIGSALYRPSAVGLSRTGRRGGQKAWPRTACLMLPVDLSSVTSILG